MTEPTTVDVVLLAYNCLDMTKLCLDALERNTPEPYRLRFFDNGSTDGTQDYVWSRLLGPEGDAALVVGRDEVLMGAGYSLRYYRDNPSIYHAWNEGVRLAESDVVVILSNDVLVGPGWLPELLAPLAGEHRLVCCSALVDPEPNDGAGHLASMVREEHPPGTVTPGFQAFAFAFHKALWLEVGGFDERYHIGFGDADFWAKAERNGDPPVIALRSLVQHLGMATRRQALGMDRDTDIEYADYEIFKEAWQHDPRILARHKLPPRGRLLEAKRWWLDGAIELQVDVGRT